MSDSTQQNARRELFYGEVRKRIHEFVNPDGTGKVAQFIPPYREVLWILPALYTGSPEYVDLANRMVAGFNTELPPDAVKPEVGTAKGEYQGKMFGIFQSNTLAHVLHRFGAKMTPEAREVAVWHTEQVFKTYQGAAQPDFKFHGANDNMPMMATCGMILGGETLGNEQAVRHGLWNLNQFRRLLSRSAWASEFNSSTYSALTVATVAKIATFAETPAIRELALQIEHRLWAELLLHYHPGTLLQAGPQSRAYCVDYAGHTHSLQIVFWHAFGKDLTGRDVLKSCFEPDGVEVMHFSGFPIQSIAEYCDFLDTDLHVPDDLARLVTERNYPALLRGRSESMGHFDGASGQYRTCTWMQPSFSLGTSNIPMCGGEQTASLYATYKLKPEVKTFKDSASVFFKYFTAAHEMGAMESATDGRFSGEKFISHQGWCYALQHENTAVLLATPNLKNTPLETDTLKLSVIFPAHYGSILRNVIGQGQVREGAVGESQDVVPVSVEAGEVFIHIQPLLPTNLPRRAALRFTRQNHYELLELVNYEGEKRSFTREALSHVLNGFVITIDSKHNHVSLLEFHRRYSDVLITDYLLSDHRFWLCQRAGLEMEVVLTSHPAFGVQTEAVNGRHVPTPVFESNQIDVDALPFMTGEVGRNLPFFPWEKLDMSPYYGNYWAIGSHGLPGETSYARRIEFSKNNPV